MMFKSYKAWRARKKSERAMQDHLNAIQKQYNEHVQNVVKRSAHVEINPHNDVVEAYHTWRAWRGTKGYRRLTGDPTAIPPPWVRDDTPEPRATVGEHDVSTSDQRLALFERDLMKGDPNGTE